MRKLEYPLISILLCTIVIAQETVSSNFPLSSKNTFQAKRSRGSSQIYIEDHIYSVDEAIPILMSILQDKQSTRIQRLGALKHLSSVGWKLHESPQIEILLRFWDQEEKT